MIGMGSQQHDVIKQSVPEVLSEAADAPHREEAFELASKTESASQRAPVVRSKAKLVASIAALFLALFIAALDHTIISTAIPTISNQFHSASGYTWVGSAYLLANAASAPLWGKVSDIWGRKIVLLAAVAVFFIGSLICAVATSMNMLIAGRVVQGSPAGGLFILVNVCISDLFSMRERGLILGLTGIVWSIASGVGPVIGGAFTELVSWRWIWYLNLPISGLAFIVLFFFLDVHNPRTNLMAGIRAIDWLGSVAIVGFTLMLLMGLNYGGVTFPWDSAKVLCLIVFGMVMFALFLLNEAKLAAYPVVPLRMFQDRSKIAIFVLDFAHGFTYIAVGYFLPLYLQSVASASPLRSGILVIGSAVTMSATALVAGIILRGTGLYLPLIWTGTLCMTLGIGLFIDLGSHFSLAKVIIFQIIAGFGIGPNFQVPLIALQAQVPQSDVATATATFGFIRNLATSISIVLGGVVFQNGMQAQGRQLEAALGRVTADKLTGGEAAANVFVLRALNGEALSVARVAFAKALRDMWIMYACMAALGLIASAFIGKQVLSKEHVETKTGLQEMKRESEIKTDIGRMDDRP